MIRYVTDGTNLYEVLAVDTAKNMGLMGGNIRQYLLQDVATYDEPFAIGELKFSKLTPVDCEDAELAVAQLHAEIDRWTEEVPEWMK